VYKSLFVCKQTNKQTNKSTAPCCKVILYKNIYSSLFSGLSFTVVCKMKANSSGPNSGSGQSQYLASVSDSLCVWSFTTSKDLLLSSTYRGTTQNSSNSNELFRATCWNHTNQVVAVAGSHPRVSLGNKKLLVKKCYSFSNLRVKINSC
jgi:hypothetical protein